MEGNSNVGVFRWHGQLGPDLDELPADWQDSLHPLFPYSCTEGDMLEYLGSRSLPTRGRRGNPTQDNNGGSCRKAHDR